MKATRDEGEGGPLIGDFLWKRRGLVMSFVGEDLRPIFETIMVFLWEVDDNNKKNKRRRGYRDGVWERAVGEVGSDTCLR